MKERAREEPRIVAAAERQMRAWEMAQQISDRLVRADEGHVEGQKLGPYVSISREAGAGGEEVAQLLGERLGWEVLDKALVDQVAERFRLSRSMLDLVDETKATWVYDLLGPWADRRIVPHEKYVVDLQRLIVAAARRGKVIFVGRGAHFILPPARGLSVRFVASEKFRMERLAKLMEFTLEQAKQYMQELDKNRWEFVSRFFHRDIADPHLYDLIINTERLGLPGTADLLAEVCRERGYATAAPASAT